MLFTYALLAAWLTLAPTSLGLPDGEDCPNGNTDCDSELCQTNEGATVGTCQSRPSDIGVSCNPSKGQEHCLSGFCDSGTLLCAVVQVGGFCTDRAYCAGGAVCESPDGGLTDPICLPVGLNAGQPCSVQEQCNSGLFCDLESGESPSRCKAGPGPGKGDYENCGGASECTSGICEDQIADDGFERVCLPGDLENDEACSHRYQCQSGNCAAGDDGDLICRDPGVGPPAPEPSPIVDPETPPDNTDEGGDTTNNNNNQQPEVVVITTVQNGQTLTLTQTRTVTVRGSSTAAASQRAASTSARPSSAAALGSSAGGAIGWIVAGAAALLGGAAL